MPLITKRSYISLLVVIAYATIDASDRSSDEQENWVRSTLIFPHEGPHAPTSSESPLRFNLYATTKRPKLSTYACNDCDTQEEPLSKYARTNTPLPPASTDEEAYADTIQLLHPPVQPDKPVSKQFLHCCIQHLQQQVAALTHAVTALQQQLQAASALSASRWLPLDELVQSWQNTVPQFIHASLEDAIAVTDSFLSALPHELRFMDHFFVQHILLAKADLYFKEFVLQNTCGYQSMPRAINPRATLCLKNAQHFFGLVNQGSLVAPTINAHTRASALHTYGALEQQLKRAELHASHFY